MDSREIRLVGEMRPSPYTPVPRTTIACLRWVVICGMVLFEMVSLTQAADSTQIERSYWLHASLGLFTQRNYFGPDFPATPAPTEQQVRNAARTLVGSYAANRLYLIYHRELPLEEARQLFLWWRQSCPPEVEIVPALVTRMYDRRQSPVFAVQEISELASFFHDHINPRHVAIYDIAPRRDLGRAAMVLAGRFPGGVIRLGLQPGEPLEPPFIEAVEDTWSAFCHGKANDRDWQQPGFGAATLRDWVRARNDEVHPTTWDLIAVAWDYSASERGSYPGYDDAEKNMPLPGGRNRLGAQLIRESARSDKLGGFSSDLYILHENSKSTAHDGRENAFYECLKRGEEYRGYYRTPLEEIAAIYREMRAENQ